MGTIYIITNKINEMKYIGQTIEFKKRFRKHCQSHSYVGKALRKYGVANFNILLLNDVPEEELNYWEKYYIKECNSLVPNGYNLQDGGCENKHQHEETKRKLREIRKNQPPTMLGKHHTEETKRKLSEITKKMIESTSFGIEIKKTQFKKGNIPWNKGIKNKFYKSPMLGKHHTEKTK